MARAYIPFVPDAVPHSRFPHCVIEADLSPQARVENQRSFSLYENTYSALVPLVAPTLPVRL